MCFHIYFLLVHKFHYILSFLDGLSSLQSLSSSHEKCVNNYYHEHISHCAPLSICNIRLHHIIINNSGIFLQCVGKGKNLLLKTDQMKGHELKKFIKIDIDCSQITLYITNDATYKLSIFTITHTQIPINFGFYFYFSFHTW